MIEILSYGNLIRSGKYKLHSQFNSAANFYCDTNFVFVVNEYVGAGPLNIVIKGVEMDTFNFLEVIDGTISIDSKKISVNSSHIYNSELEIENFNKEKLAANLSLFESSIKVLAPDNSLAFLLDYREQNKSASSFELEYKKRIRAGIEEFSTGDILSGVKLVKGLGPGLTPSGDDFISGFLISLNFISKVLHIDFTESISSVYNNSVSNNLFANAFLYSSSKGFVSEKFKRLIYSLLYGNKDQILTNTESLLSIGKTSGIDQAVGFIIGVKRFLI